MRKLLDSVKGRNDEEARTIKEAVAQLKLPSEDD